MRANSIIPRSFVFLAKQTGALIKTVMETAHLLCSTLPICTAERGSDTARPRGSARSISLADCRGKESARSIQISPVCSHPSPTPTRQRLAVSFIFRDPISRSIPGYPNALRRHRYDVSAHALLPN